MNQIEAFKETVKLARQRPWHTIKDGCSVIHLEDMYKKIVEDQAKKQPEFSAAKIGRWLGWAQAVVCMYSPLGLKLDDFKEINRKCR